jgi:hypothetical protein
MILWFPEGYIKLNLIVVFFVTISPLREVPRPVLLGQIYETAVVIARYS